MVEYLVTKPMLAQRYLGVRLLGKRRKGPWRRVRKVCLVEIPTIVVVIIAPMGDFEVAVSAETVMVGFEPAEAPFIGAGEPEWVRERREAAYLHLGKVSFPSPSEEIWRYSRVEELQEKAYSLSQADPDLVVLGAPAVEGLPGGLIAGAAALIRIRPGGARIHLPGGSAVAFGAPAPSSPAARHIEPGQDFFRLFSEAYSPDLYVLSVPDGADSGSVVVVYEQPEDGVTFMPQLVVEVGEGARLNLVEYLAPGASETLVAPSAEIRAAKSATVGHYQIQALAPGAYASAFVSHVLGEGAKLDFGAFAFGGRYARLRLEAHLAGEGARAELRAAYFANEDQMLDFRTHQDHHSPGAYSNLLFKGAVAGTSHSVYSGLVTIEEGAVRSDAYQTNRNLVLSDGARADSVPNLDIRENSVRCSHASAVGPIDEELLFYLESRGIAPTDAERIVIRGFFREVLEGIDLPEVVGLVQSLVDARLGELAE